MSTITNRLSRARAATHLAQQAVARWRDGSATAHTAQQRWHDQINREFVAWLTAGGFHAASAGPAKTAALRRCSQSRNGTTDEELKFTLVRIDDAVK